MSKNVKETKETATTATAAVHTETAVSLQSLFTKYPNASLRKIAQVTGVCYGVLLKKSKDPIPGEAYDPEVTNWQAIEAHLLKKGIDYTTLDWESMNAGVVRHGATLEKDMSKFTVGMKVYLRQNNDVPYEIVYKTATHVVIMLEGTSEPQAWSYNTFLMHGPAMEPRTERKSKEEA